MIQPQYGPTPQKLSQIIIVAQHIVFTAELFIVAKLWNQIRCPSTEV